MFKMSKLSLQKQSPISETLQVARTSTPTANACSWISYQKMLSGSKVILEEVQESKPKCDICNELIVENALLKKKFEDFETKYQLKDKALQVEKENNRQTNEYLIVALLKVESLEKKLTLANSEVGVMQEKLQKCQEANSLLTLDVTNKESFLICLNDKDLQNGTLDGFFQTSHNWKGTIDNKKKSFATIENEHSSVSTINEYFADTNTVTCEITEQKKGIKHSSTPLKLPSPKPSTSKEMKVLQTQTERKAMNVRNASHSTTDDDFIVKPTSPILKRSARKRLSLTKSNDIQTPTPLKVNKLSRTAKKNRKK